MNTVTNTPPLGQVAQVVETSVKSLFRDAVRLTRHDPGLALFLLRMLRRQNGAARTRNAWQAQGLQVPPFMIVSVTRRCNLRCKGCYARAMHPTTEAEFSSGELRSLLDQARELGIGIVLLAGGEPLVRPDLLEITRDYPDLMFALFTNGLLIDEAVAAELARQRHVVPVISFEGFREETDARRGEGVYERLEAVTRQLRQRRVFFGTSLTVTRQNYATVTGDSYLGSLLGLGCKLFFFVEYVPVEPGTDELTLDDDQRCRLPRLMEELRASQPGLFIAFPGDEEAFGGCLAAGRGFVHVSPEGNVEPCPFAPVSDTNVRRRSLKEALASEFLSAIRENHALLTETRGGCALWAKRDWVASLLPETGVNRLPVLNLK